ncbi:MotE family protein [Rhodobium gokarnense]|uniref:Flagellar motility protein MotE (MotC chaperone) n=1 Tax=Rhodobium gokarnense TaxID=364296 RepID=A0ABT3HD56_9HYPH|nr:hypothetical protein [Rhodobium gokarnense]MCW2308331.1 flagellar motility protein MotE (MotC chaperone) [Rhodobium gokarnense]
MNNLRLLPIVIVAGGALCFFKVIGLAFDGGYLLAPIPEAVAQQQDAAPAPMDAGTAEAAPAGEGSAETAPAEAAAEPAPPPPPLPAAANQAPVQGHEVKLGQGSPAERAVLERLGERHETLKSREEDLKLREQLLRAAEERLEQRVTELKKLEKTISTGVQQKKEEKNAKLADLVKMYETMKPKAAAKIFDRLDLLVLVPVAKQMKPQKLGDVMARMTPEAAEKLTVALATDEITNSVPQKTRTLPKIQGRKPAASGS